MADLPFDTNLPVCVPIDETLEECGGTITIQGREHHFLIKELKKKMTRINEKGSFGDMYKLDFQGTMVAVKAVQIENDERRKFNSKPRVDKEIDVSQKSASNCKYVVQFFGCALENCKSYMFLEFVECTLKECILACNDISTEQKKIYKFDENIVGNIVIATVSGLSYLKECNLVHRDVKPSNILISKEGCVKLCDFGMVGELVHSHAYTSQTGTKSYLSPEKLIPSADSNRIVYDVRADIWSLGVSLVYACTGVHPYEAKGDFELFEKIVKGDPPMLTSKNYKLNNFVNFCLVKDVQRRPKLAELKEKNFFKEHSTRTELDERITADLVVKEVLKRKERGDFANR